QRRRLVVAGPLQGLVANLHDLVAGLQARGSGRRARHGPGYDRVRGAEGQVDADARVVACVRLLQTLVCVGVVVGGERVAERGDQTLHGPTRELCSVDVAVDVLRLDQPDRLLQLRRVDAPIGVVRDIRND